MSAWRTTTSAAKAAEAAVAMELAMMEDVGVAVALVAAVMVEVLDAEDVEDEAVAAQAAATMLDRMQEWFGLVFHLELLLPAGSRCAACTRIPTVVQARSLRLRNGRSILLRPWNLFFLFHLFLLFITFHVIAEDARVSVGEQKFSVKLLGISPC